MHISLASGTWRQFVVRTVVDGSLFWGGLGTGTPLAIVGKLVGCIGGCVCVRRKRRLITHITQMLRQRESHMDRSESLFWPPSTQHQRN